MKNKIEKKILNLFLFNHGLKFNEIEKLTGKRSNKLAYHLKNLMKKDILKKQDNYYSLSETSEYFIPYLSDKKAVLPAVLIFIGNKNSCFLFKREKRPYMGKLSLPGGRLLVGETIKQATKRIMEEKFNLPVSLEKIHSISLEHVKNETGRIMYGFLLIFVSATTKQKIQTIEIEKNKNKIIKSDCYLINNHLNKKAEVKEIDSKI